MMTNEQRLLLQIGKDWDQVTAYMRDMSPIMIRLGDLLRQHRSRPAARSAIVQAAGDQAGDTFDLLTTAATIFTALWLERRRAGIDDD
jgi:hypothetical protein